MADAQHQLSVMEENYPESNWSTYNEDVLEGAGKPDQHYDRLLVALPVTKPQFWFTGTEQAVLEKNITHNKSTAVP